MKIVNKVTGKYCIADDFCKEYHKEVLMEYIVGLDMIRRGWIK